MPKVKDKGWAQSPVDLFILAKLEEKGMNPSRQGRPANAHPARHF